MPDVGQCGGDQLCAYATSLVDGKAYLWGSPDGMFEADIENGTVGSFQLVTDAKHIMLTDEDSVLYYGNDYYVSGDQIYMDLYSRSGGAN